jgi:hypothetical protein
MTQESHSWELKFSIDKRCKNYRMSMVVFPRNACGKIKVQDWPCAKSQIPR